MGKKRITELLDQLKEIEGRDRANAAAIYTVAQVAVNELVPRAEELVRSTCANGICQLTEAEKELL